MNKEYLLTGTRITIRRLFKWDIQDILQCYSDYDSLFYNPFDRQFVENVFLQGEFWGAFVQDSLISCCCYFPLDSDFYKTDKSCDALMDFIPNPEKCFFMGYVGFCQPNIEKYFSADDARSIRSTIYKACLNIAEMQAFRQGFRYIVHCVPIKITEDIFGIFRCGYRLLKLRGLEKLVVHYIFAKAVMAENRMDFSCSETVCLKDTKKVSALLENGYLAFDIADNDDSPVLSFAPLITD